MAKSWRWRHCWEESFSKVGTISSYIYSCASPVPSSTTHLGGDRKEFWGRLRKYFFYVSEIHTFRRCFPTYGSPSKNLTHGSVFGFRRIMADVRHAFFCRVVFSSSSFLFLFAPCFSFVFRKVRGGTRKPWGRGREKGFYVTFLLAPTPPPPPPPPTMVFSFDLCLAFALFVSYFTNHKRRTYQQNRLARGLPFLVALQVIHHPSHHTWMGLCSQSAHPHLSHEEV